MNHENLVFKDMFKSEQEVGQFLREIALLWRYEQPVFVIDEKERPRLWTPDFYLPELGVYVEVCGTDNFDYTYRQEIYEKNKVPVIFIHAYKHDKWRSYLIKRIREIHEERLNLVKIMVQKAEKL